jgi:hypothetical protein
MYNPTGYCAGGFIPNASDSDPADQTHNSTENTASLPSIPNAKHNDRTKQKLKDCDVSAITTEPHVWIRPHL